MSLFKKAVKSESKLRLAITGPSGSGKTYTGLMLAAALADGGVAVIDTENGSASKYADVFEFDVAEMHAPFSPAKYVAAITEAANAGYKVILLDSLTHAWSGTGGLLDIVDEAAKKSQSKNTYMAWKEGTPLQNQLIDAIIQAPIHVIATMRSKAEYVLETNDRGKQAPKKVGMAPIQRDGMEYEFDIVLQMTLDNDAIVEKTRCSAIAGRVLAKPGKDLAATLKTWLSGAKADAAPTTQPTPTPKPAPAATNGAQHRQPPAQAPKSVDADTATLAASVNATITNVSEFDAIPDAKTSDALDKARKAFHATVASTFPKGDVDDARHWFVKKYTTAYTPDNVRESSDKLTVDELSAMTEAMKARTKNYRDQWTATKTAPIPAEKQTA
jgi:hypothetical protein